MWQVRRKWAKCVASGSSASQLGQVRRKCVKCVASGSSASQVGHACCKSKCVKWVKCVASGASGSNRLIIPTPEQVCQVCQHTCNQLLVPVCTHTEIMAFMAIIMGLGPLCYILLGFRYRTYKYSYATGGPSLQHFGLPA